MNHNIVPGYVKYVENIQIIIFDLSQDYIDKQEALKLIEEQLDKMMGD